MCQKLFGMTVLFSVIMGCYQNRQVDYESPGESNSIASVETSFGELSGEQATQNPPKLEIAKSLRGEQVYALVVANQLDLANRGLEGITLGEARHINRSAGARIQIPTESVKNISDEAGESSIFLAPRDAKIFAELYKLQEQRDSDGQVSYLRPYGSLWLVLLPCSTTTPEFERWISNWGSRHVRELSSSLQKSSYRYGRSRPQDVFNIGLFHDSFDKDLVIEYLADSILNAPAPNQHELLTRCSVGIAESLDRRERLSESLQSRMQGRGVESFLLLLDEHSAELKACMALGLLKDAASVGALQKMLASTTDPRLLAGHAVALAIRLANPSAFTDQDWLNLSLRFGPYVGSSNHILEYYMTRLRDERGDGYLERESQSLVDSPVDAYGLIQLILQQKTEHSENLRIELSIYRRSRIFQFLKASRNRIESLAEISLDRLDKDEATSKFILNAGGVYCIPIIVERLERVENSSKQDLLEVLGGLVELRRNDDKSVLEKAVKSLEKSADTKHLAEKLKAALRPAHVPLPPRLNLQSN